MHYSPLTKYQAADIRARDAALHAWMKEHRTNSYHPSEVVHLNSPTNAERSACEVFEFLHDPPEVYFLYMLRGADGLWRACTWTGDVLSAGLDGRALVGRKYKGSFGDERCSVRFEAINGFTYAGTFYSGAGDYARVRRVRS